MFLVGTVSFIDTYVLLGNRILAPVYICSLILVVSLIDRLPRQWAWIGIVTLSAAVLPAQIADAAKGVEERGADGVGYQRYTWRHSDVIGFVRSLPRGTRIYSNAPDAIALLAERTAEMLPRIYEPTSRLVNEEVVEQLEDLAGHMQKGAVIVFFDGLSWRDYLVSMRHLAEVMDLAVVHRGADGVVYATSSEPPKSSRQASLVGCQRPTQTLQDVDSVCATHLSHANRSDEQMVVVSCPCTPDFPIAGDGLLLSRSTEPSANMKHVRPSHMCHGLDPPLRRCSESRLKRSTSACC
jgi:hypothetical protein